MPMQAGFLWPSPRGCHGDCTGTAWGRPGDGMGTARAVTRPGLDVPGQGIWQPAVSNSARVSCWWLHRTPPLCSVPTPGFGFIHPERNTAAMAMQLSSWGFPVVAGDKSPRCRVSAQSHPLLSRGPLPCGARARVTLYTHHMAPKNAGPALVRLPRGCSHPNRHQEAWWGMRWLGTVAPHFRHKERHQQ